MDNKLGYVSLFSSAGVGCYGFKLEGYDCIVTSELIKRRLDIQKFNNVCSDESGYIGGDITNPEVHAQIFNVIDNWKRKNQKNEVDVLVATPPCQGISVANHKKGDELGRNSLVVESLKIISQVQPRYFVLENVRGFLNTLCTDVDDVTKTIREAIKLNLAGQYNIDFKVLNFKDYGSNSSRTRTLVIGVRKDIEEVTPYDLFPNEKAAPRLRELIVDLPSLTKMGEIHPDDIYHSFRRYDERMLPWIADTKEGESAFDNEDPKKRPHKIVDGQLVANQNKNGDKYKRCYWDAIAPCVHTRNDILASQNTIHPTEPRVFSIRELMRFMSIPQSFKWSDQELDELNKLSEDEKVTFLKKQETNIRQCLGEGVPTGVFQSIAQNIRRVENSERLSLNKIKRLIEKNDLSKADKLLDYLVTEKLDFVTASKIAELANAKRLDDAAYYTRQDLCFSVVVDLPDFKNKSTLRILEPSVGVGNFLPTIFEKYRGKDKVHLDVVDISEESIQILKRVLKSLKVPPNFELRIINDDFLLHEFRNKYDLVVGNPPFGKTDPKKFAVYKSMGVGSVVKTRNLFALFFEKALGIADTVALVSPKSLLNAPEFGELRKSLENCAIIKINDYGEKGFNGVKIETISTIASNVLPKGTTIVESHILNSYKVHSQDYITNPSFPYWLIYRDNYFDEMVEKLELDLFSVYRDRTLTSKNMKSKGKIRVIKSRNVQDGEVVQREDDQYVDDLAVSPIAEKFFNQEVVVAPNLSYYPRATFLPPNSIVDGSAAILVPKKSIKLTKEELKFFASREYFLFYRIARNFATRSLNIDSGSVFFWGIPKAELEYKTFEVENRSNYLFMTPAHYFAEAV